MSKNTCTEYICFSKSPWRYLPLTLLIIVVDYSIATAAHAQTKPAISTLTSTMFDCLVEPSELVKLGSAIPGRIDKIHVERNDSVEKEQAVVELESEVARTVVDSARAQVNATSAIEIRRRDASFSKQQEERTKDLFSRMMVSEQEYHRLLAESDIAYLQFLEAKENQKLAYLNTLQAKAQLNQLIIRSPIAGVIVERYKTIGEYVDDDPVLVIANLDTLNIELLVPVALMGKVKLGMTAKITPSPEHYGTHRATVTLVDKVADAPSGTFRVRLQIDNEEHLLPSGLRCVAQFDDMETPPAIMSAEPVNRRSHPSSESDVIKSDAKSNESP